VLDSLRRLLGGKEARPLDMVRLGKAAGCSVGFSTNATHLRREVAKELVALGLDWIAYSVDGASAATYEAIRRGASFRALLENLQAMQAAKEAQGSAKPKTLFFFVMMRANIHELPALVELAHDLGIAQVVAKNLDVILKGEDDRERLFSYEASSQPEAAYPAIHQAQEKARRLGLPLGIYALAPREAAVYEQNPLDNVFFSWEGFVSPCITLAYAERRVFGGEWHDVARQRFGDINREELGDIWEKQAYGGFRQAFQRRAQAWLWGALGSLPEELHSAEGLALPPAPEGCRTCHYLYGV